jgi:hypothetical protein
MEKFNVWFSNKLLPPPDGQVWVKQGKTWQPQSQVELG